MKQTLLLWSWNINEKLSLKASDNRIMIIKIILFSLVFIRIVEK